MKHLLLFLSAFVSCSASSEFQQFVQELRAADRIVIEWRDEKAAEYYGLKRVCADLERADEIHSLTVSMVEDDYEYEISWKTKEGEVIMSCLYCAHEEHYAHVLRVFSKGEEVNSYRFALDGRRDALLLGSGKKLKLAMGSVLFAARHGALQGGLCQDREEGG